MLYRSQGKSLVQGFFTQRNRRVVLVEAYMTALKGKGTSQKPHYISNKNPLKMDYNPGRTQNVVVKAVKIRKLGREQWDLVAEVGRKEHDGVNRVLSIPIKVKGNTLRQLRSELKKAFGPPPRSTTGVVFE